MNVVLPFFRKHLQKELIRIYGIVDVVLYPIQHEELEWGKDWIKPVMYPKDERKPFDICYDKLNYFKETQDIRDDEYYICMGDDDSVELKLFAEVDKMNDDVVVVSMMRGDDVPLRGSICGTGPLIAAPEMMKVWFTGMEQIIMKGHVFKKMKYRNDTHIGDGYMAEDVISAGYTPAYRSDLYIMHNYYQPGRYARLGEPLAYEGI